MSILRTDTPGHSGGVFKGNWDASTNNPTLADGIGTANDYYIVDVAGTQDLGHGAITFSINDQVWYSDGGEWIKVDAPYELWQKTGNTIHPIIDGEKVDVRTGEYYSNGTRFITDYGGLDTISLGHSTGSVLTDTTYIGNYAGFEGTGIESTFVGNWAGYQNIGIAVTAIGNHSANANTGAYVCAVGHGASTNNTASYVNAFGAWAGNNNSGVYCTFIGSSAGSGNQGDNITAIGFEAANNNTGDDVIAIGYEAGESNSLANQYILKQANINATPLQQGDFGTGITTFNGVVEIGTDVDLDTGGLQDNDVTTTIMLGDASNTSFSTSNKTIVGAVNELKLLTDRTVYREVHILDATDMANKYVTLARTPDNEASVDIKVKNSSDHLYGYSYVLIGDNVSWDGYDLDGELSIGTIMSITYIS